MQVFELEQQVIAIRKASVEMLLFCTEHMQSADVPNGNIKRMLTALSESEDAEKARIARCALSVFARMSHPRPDELCNG